VPGVQGVEGDDLPTLLEVLHFVDLQLDLILHTHIRLNLSDLTLLVDGVRTLTLKDLMQTLLLKIFLCLFRFKVSQREAQLGD
jgi:hypothetical protein